MSKPEVAGDKPVYQELKEGRTYFWCACGRSKKQPFCDGSHKGTGIEPLPYKAACDGEEVLLCTCKQTKDGPHCDGSHNDLPGAYSDDDPTSETNKKIALTPARDDPLTMLDGGCYVFSPERANVVTHGALSYCRVISPAQGAQHQSQFYAEIDGAGPPMAFGDRYVILFVAAGEGVVNIAGHESDIAPNMGVYVRPGEAFLISTTKPAQVFISACPVADDPSWPTAVGKNFDKSKPNRIVAVDPEQRHDMGPRYFQMLVDKDIGCTGAAQFIGHIPKSKAWPHRHLYEESLIILRGEGMMWTATRKTPVKAGDVIFLPRKEQHSLESVSADGMDVVGVIY
ncbi:MAG: CDGSH iron-sulfur domain-containing protein, partial [Hyphomicrobiales bacterium]|nr:CDGSH iron-sulfur domain-containing protein [Hyphomicrobiales bacterium]